MCCASGVADGGAIQQNCDAPFQIVHRIKLSWLFLLKENTMHSHFAGRPGHKLCYYVCYVH